MAHSPRSARRVQCLLCPMTITLNNFSTHLKNKHPASYGQRPRSRWYDELDGSAPVALVKVAPDAASASHPPPRSTPPVVAAGPERAPGLPPLDLDDIVLAVTQQLTEPAGLLPVGHLPALFAWREATAAFLRSVSHESSG